MVLADSQLLFHKDSTGIGGHSLLQGVYEALKAGSKNAKLKAAYIGALNGDVVDFYEIFVSAMEVPMRISAS